MTKYYSPLRYPGGKGVLAKAISNIIISNNLEGSSYLEPFSGGSSVALYLLMNNFVKEIHLNDADYNIYAFWKCVLNKNTEILNKIKSSNVSIEEWHKQKQIISSPGNYSELEIGFACFFLNRCNRSGIIKDAGPIGGINQNGKWKIDARFNKLNLCERISNINLYRDRIFINNYDAISYLKKIDGDSSNIFVYLDPPYYNKGQELYLNFYEHTDHKRLASFLNKESNLNWVMSYDNTSEIKELYRNYKLYEYNLNYSVQDKKKGKEIFIVPNHIYFPSNFKNPVFKIAS